MPRMTGGEDEHSYTRNSQVQARSIDLFMKALLEDEISKLAVLKGQSIIKVADLGCSTGDNTLRYAQLIWESIHKHHGGGGGVEVHYFFSDLPTNDFNTLFQQVQGWESKMGTMSSSTKLYPAAAPGSFYKRLFPCGSVHIVLSTWSLQILSQVPEAVMDKTSTSYNKHRAHIPRGSPEAVVKAYGEQAKKNLHEFILCRAHEVVSGGLVVLLLVGREDERHPDNQWGKDLEVGTPFGSIFENTWKALVLEGTISEELWNSFNFQIYARSLEEVKVAVEATNLFHIKELQQHEQSFLDYEEEKKVLADPEAFAQFYISFVGGVMHSNIANHIGYENIDKFFQRLAQTAREAIEQKLITKLAMTMNLVVLIRT